MGDLGEEKEKLKIHKNKQIFLNKYVQPGDCGLYVTPNVLILLELLLEVDLFHGTTVTEFVIHALCRNVDKEDWEGWNGQDNCTAPEQDSISVNFFLELVEYLSRAHQDYSDNWAYNECNVAVEGSLVVNYTEFCVST